MGMAASQARYLALVARKSNCEYEGQQINQARLVLSNQTAHLFNQMLGLSVPVPPSTQDYTKIQYSFTTGASEAVIDKWDQLANPEPDYNYVVSYHFFSDVFTGSQKRLVDPQVQFSSSSLPSDLSTLTQLVREITSIKKDIADKEARKSELEKERATLQIQQATLSNYANTDDVDISQDISYDEETDKYTFQVITGQEGTTEEKVYTGYDKLTPEDQASVNTIFDQLTEYKLISSTFDINNIYYCSDGTIAFKSDLDKLTTKTSATLPTYKDIETKYNEYAEQIANLTDEISNYETDILNAQKELKEKELSYDELYSHPTYIGNCEVELLESPDLNQEAELLQIWKDLQEVSPESNIYTCFDQNGNYIGGIYTFRMGGIDYYTTLADLEAAYQSGTGINNIDGQDKLYYYNAAMIKTRFEKKEKALLETDNDGRFSSVRFEDDSVAYTLNFEQVTDDVAYKDAMNKFNYENALYAKMVQDINAKTSIIQQEDRTLELRLKQLDTEQNALSQEMEAVQKVVKDNVEKSFKTFGG